MPFVSVLKLSMADNGSHRLVPVIKSNRKKSIQFLIKAAQWLELLRKAFSLSVHLAFKPFLALQNLNTGKLWYFQHVPGNREKREHEKFSRGNIFYLIGIGRVGIKYMMPFGNPKACFLLDLWKYGIIYKEIPLTVKVAV